MISFCGCRPCASESVASDRASKAAIRPFTGCKVSNALRTSARLTSGCANTACGTGAPKIKEKDVPRPASFTTCSASRSAASKFVPPPPGASVIDIEPSTTTATSRPPAEPDPFNGHQRPAPAANTPKANNKTVTVSNLPRHRFSGHITVVTAASPTPSKKTGITTAHDTDDPASASGRATHNTTSATNKHRAAINNASSS